MSNSRWAIVGAVLILCGATLWFGPAVVAAEWHLRHGSTVALDNHAIPVPSGWFQAHSDSGVNLTHLTPTFSTSFYRPSNVEIRSASAGELKGTAVFDRWKAQLEKPDLASAAGAVYQLGAGDRQAVCVARQSKIHLIAEQIVCIRKDGLEFSYGGSPDRSELDQIVLGTS